MKPSFILSVFLFALLSAANEDDDTDRPPCCPKKIVGGKTYMLAGELDKMEAMQYQCSSPASTPWMGMMRSSASSPANRSPSAPMGCPTTP